MDDRQILETAPREADLAAVDELAEARRTLLGEIEKRIVGQRAVVDHLLIALFARGHSLFVGVPGLAKTLLISTAGRGPRPLLQPHPVHPRPDAVGHHRHRRPRGGPRHRARAPSASCQGPSSPTSSSPTRSTAPRPRPRRRCCRPCRSTGSPPAAAPTRSTCPSSSSPPRTPSSRRAPTRCPRPSSTASCSCVDVDYPSAAEEEVRDRPAPPPSATRPTLQQVLSPERIRAAPGAGAARAGRRPRGALRGGPGAATRAPRSRARPTSCKDYVAWGAGPARQPVPGARRQGPRHPRRALRRLGGGRARAGPAGARATGCSPNFRAESEGVIEPRRWSTGCSRR